MSSRNWPGSTLTFHVYICIYFCVFFWGPDSDECKTVSRMLCTVWDDGTVSSTTPLCTAALLNAFLLYIFRISPNSYRNYNTHSSRISRQSCDVYRYFSVSVVFVRVSSYLGERIASFPIVFAPTFAEKVAAGYMPRPEGQTRSRNNQYFVLNRFGLVLSSTLSKKTFRKRHGSITHIIH